MTDSTTTLPWLVIREDDNGNRYRVGRYATKAEAQRIADSLDDRGHKQLYWVERLAQEQVPGQNGTVR
ncbi:SPOR domain-containing protein [Streptomyces sp. NPDC050400]|uniref:SPOR domain-containing protein n=1 Tax=Streptomyces sp. NPDC050400 TaxID=3365610 RepID=UPI0037B5A788